MTRDEHIARAEESHPLRAIAAAHVTQLRAERAENRRFIAGENRAETIGAARFTAAEVLGEQAANTLAWETKPSGLDAFADLGQGLFLTYTDWTTSMIPDNGAPGFLTLVLRCSECGSRWAQQIESLEKLAHWLEDLPKKPVGREATG